MALRVLFCDDHPDEVYAIATEVQAVLHDAMGTEMEICPLFRLSDDEAGRFVSGENVTGVELVAFIVNDYQLRRGVVDESCYDALICDVSWGSDTDIQGILACKALQDSARKSSWFRICCVTNRQLRETAEVAVRAGLKFEFNGFKVFSKVSHARELAEWIEEGLVLMRRGDANRHEPSHLAVLGRTLNQLLLQGPLDTLLHQRDFFWRGSRADDGREEYGGGSAVTWLDGVVREAEQRLTDERAVGGMPRTVRQSLLDLAGYLRTCFDQTAPHLRLLESGPRSTFQQVAGRLKNVLVGDELRLGSPLHSSLLRLEHGLQMTGLTRAVLDAVRGDALVAERAPSWCHVDVSRTEQAAVQEAVKAYLPADCVHSLFLDTHRHARPTEFFTDLRAQPGKKLVWLIAHDGVGFSSQERLEHAVQNQGWGELAGFCNLFCVTSSLDSRCPVAFEVLPVTGAVPGGGDLPQVRRMARPYIKLDESLFHVGISSGSAFVMVIPTVEQQY